MDDATGDTIDEAVEDDLLDRCSRTRSRDDFVAFLDTVVESIETSPGRWQNDSLETFLEAWRAWINDMDGYFLNHGMPVRTDFSWDVAAMSVLAARIYD